MIDGLSINKFIFVIFLLFNLIDSALPSCLDTVVMLPDEELYDSIKKLFLSSFDRLLIFDDLKLDRIEKRVFRSDKEIQLGPTEFRLLEFFLTNPKRVYSRDQILETVWPNNVNVESRTIDVHIRRLRQSINIEGKKELIRTVRASGYSLV